MVIDYPNSSKAKKYYLCLSFERAFKVRIRFLFQNIAIAVVLNIEEVYGMHRYSMYNLTFCVFFLCVNNRYPERWVQAVERLPWACRWWAGTEVR